MSIKIFTIDRSGRGDMNHQYGVNNTFDTNTHVTIVKVSSLSSRSINLLNSNVDYYKSCNISYNTKYGYKKLLSVNDVQEIESINLEHFNYYTFDFMHSERLKEITNLRKERNKLNNFMDDIHMETFTSESEIKTKEDGEEEIKFINDRIWNHMEEIKKLKKQKEMLPDSKFSEIVEIPFGKVCRIRIGPDESGFIYRDYDCYWPFDDKMNEIQEFKKRKRFLDYEVISKS